MRGARGYGLIEKAPLRHQEVHDRRGEFEILRAACSLLRSACFQRPLLREPHSLLRMNFLKLVLASEFQDHAARIALQGLKSDALDLDISGQCCGLEQVCFPREQKSASIRTARISDVCACGAGITC